MRASSILSLLLWSSVISTASAGLFKKKHRRQKAGTKYAQHDEVHIVVNKVGPFNNPTETYRYYSLPFCRTHADESAHKEAYEEERNIALAEEEEEASYLRKLEIKGNRIGAERHKQRLGESIAGDRRETSPYELSFQDDIEWRLLCKTTLDKRDLIKLKEAIHNNYFFEMFIEDLPMWGYVGDIEDEDEILGEVEGQSHTYLFPHLHFRLGYNKNQIVSATVTTERDRKVDITNVNKPTPVQFSYSVEYFEDDLPWRMRMTRYADSRFLPGSFEIHWLSIINSFVLVLLLTAFLTIILMRVLKNDFSRYMEIDDSTMEEEESGWKLIHGDVFRFPEYPVLFCASVGTGVQLTIATLLLLGLALTGMISTTRRGSILAGMVILYCLTTTVGAYISTRLYFQMNGKNWVRCVLFTAGLFPVPTSFVFMWVNTVALFHGSTSALPFSTIFTIAAIFALVALPLTVLGGIVAKNYANHDFNAPTRTTKVAREIPTEVPWYRTRFVQMVISGFLPFSAIYIELHYIFASMWGHQIYTLFGILLFAFVLLLVVTSFISVALLYFQLAKEDHRWWWSTFINAGMTGLFIYAYSFFYYFHRSGMSGMLQSSFYFGYMSIVSFGFFLMLGSCGFHFSLLFVKHIYSRVKCD
ncbi:hypothetical protein ACHAWT_003632 [Skeletonema menzelii]